MNHLWIKAFSGLREGSDLAEARLLAGPFTRSQQDLAAGRISEGHVRTLVFETRYVVDDPTPHPDLHTPADAPVAAPRSREDKLAAIQARVADQAWTQTTAQFQRTVQYAICAVDPAGEADRRAAALKARDVTALTDIDGMGVLVDRDDDASVQAMLTELTRLAKVLQADRGGTSAVRQGDDDARIGACRADVLKKLILTGPAAAAADGAVTTVVNPPGEALVAQGSALEPPARVLGAYLPKALTRFIHARDGVCTAPYCQRPATRCQMDHRIPYPLGPSNTTNCGDLCDRHHPLKTDGYVTITDGCSDGSMTWHTKWGQEVRTEPRPYLASPGTYGLTDAPPDDDVGPPDDLGPPGGDKPFPF